MVNEERPGWPAIDAVSGRRPAASGHEVNHAPVEASEEERSDDSGEDLEGEAQKQQVVGEHAGQGRARDEPFRHFHRGVAQDLQRHEANGEEGPALHS